MFGTEIKLSTFLFLCIESVFFVFQLSNYLSRPHDKSRLRFVILTLTFIFYNICSGFLPDPNYLLNIFVQNVLAYGSGILVASYYFYYLVKELNINQKRLFNVRVLVWSLLISFVLGYIISFEITGNLILSKKIFIVFPMLISVYFCVFTVKSLLISRKNFALNETPYLLMVQSGYLGIIFMATMPIVVFFGDFQVLNNTLVNISFFLALYAYVKHHFYHCKIENDYLLNSGFFNLKKHNPSNVFLNNSINIVLTSRELEIAKLISKDLNYYEIGEKMFIAPKTVSKHASNIFKKTECKSKKEFIQKFQKDLL